MMYATRLPTEQYEIIRRVLKTLTNKKKKSVNMMLANSAIFNLIMSYISVIMSDDTHALNVYLGNDKMSYVFIIRQTGVNDAAHVDFTACDDIGRMVGYSTEIVETSRIFEISHGIVLGNTTIFFDQIGSIVYDDNVVYTRD